MAKCASLLLLLLVVVVVVVVAQHVPTLHVDEERAQERVRTAFHGAEASMKNTVKAAQQLLRDELAKFRTQLPASASSASASSSAAASAAAASAAAAASLSRAWHQLHDTVDARAPHFAARLADVAASLRTTLADVREHERKLADAAAERLHAFYSSQLSAVTRLVRSFVAAVRRHAPLAAAHTDATIVAAHWTTPVLRCDACGANFTLEQFVAEFDEHHALSLVDDFFSDADFDLYYTGLATWANYRRVRCPRCHASSMWRSVQPASTSTAHNADDKAEL